MGWHRRFYYFLFPSDNKLRKFLSPILGFTPITISLYERAFIHKSLINESKEDIQSNERLEFLGDALLNSIVADYLFYKFPQKNEGFLTKMRAKIVKRSTLNNIADELSLDQILEQYNNVRLSRSMLGNTLEALIGAIYIDRGYSATQKFVVDRLISRHLDLEHLIQVDDNHKSKLLELCQKENHEIVYELMSKERRNKRDFFKIGIKINGAIVATAEDFNKKGAEQKASKAALRKLV